MSRVSIISNPFQVGVLCPPSIMEDSGCCWIVFKGVFLIQVRLGRGAPHGDFLIINTSRCSVDLYSAVLSPVLKNFMFHVYTHGIQITTMSPAQHLTTSCQVHTLHISKSLSNEMKTLFWIVVAIILIYLQPKKSNILIAIYHKHVCNRNPGDVCDGRPAEHSGAWGENQSLNRCEVH